MNKDLFNYLPYRYAEKVAKKTGKSKSLVYKVKTGEKENLAVLRELVKSAKNNKKKREAIMKASNI